ncbi:hypothetical protein F511_18106 [Dorcoceras hygrometricum]|uniref:Uncharacterized protein n=1 Tax=Dorcoceras hygrometricum TaxID=472368 RepID=A0A2Z7B9Q0_9LAMI|nr:hypothetical protein F511_18106 [Dorcoceras hygrometricum]
MMDLGRGGNGAGGNSSSSSSNLSASAPPFTVDRSNANHNSNPLVHYPESSYGTEPFSHASKYTNSSSHKPELDMHSTRTTSFPLTEDCRLSDVMSTSRSRNHWMDCSRDAKTLGNNFAYGGGWKSYYRPSVPPMVEESSTLVEDGSTYTRRVIDRDYRPEWMHRQEFNQFISGQQSKRVELDGSFSSGRGKIGDLPPQIDYTRFAIDQDYMPQHIDSLASNGFHCGGVELDGSCSSHMANVGDRSAQFEYTQSAYDGEYMPQQMESLNVNGNLYKRAELDGNFRSDRAELGGSHTYKSLVNEGCEIDFVDKSREIYGKSNRINDTAVGFLTVECVNDKLPIEQNPGFLVSGSAYPESRPLSLSHEIHENFLDSRSSCSPYEKRVRSDDSAFTSSISVTRSSPTVVIMPPPAIPNVLAQRHEPAGIENEAGVCNVHFDRSNPSNSSKDPCPKPSSEIKEGSFDPKFYKQCNDRGFLSSSVANAFSSSLHINDSFDRNIKERFDFEISDSNYSRGLAMANDNVQVVNSTEDSSDVIEHHNLAVDSPCWRGAPSSQFSALDVETGSSHNFIGKLNENCGFDEAKHEDFGTLADPTRVLPAKFNVYDENLFVKNNIVFPLGSILDANHPSKEQILSGDAKAENFIVSTSRSSKGVQTGDALELPRINSDFPENLNNCSHTISSDLKHFTSKDEFGINPNDASETNGAVAFHVAEKVLASPPSQEDAIEHVELQPDSEIKTTIKTMHYLSEILFAHLSSDACTLGEEDILTLKHTVSNLDACMSSKIARPRNKQEPMGYISKKIGEFHDMGFVGYKHGHAKNSERAEKSPFFPFSGDDTDLTRDDDMAKSINKVLEENFLCNEEMDSQAIFFKSLWLEAEATLCSISYKARFDRLKIEMEQAKPKSSKG